MKKESFIKIILLAVLTCILANTALADTYWTNADPGDQDWSTAGNWDIGVPNGWTTGWAQINGGMPGPEITTTGNPWVPGVSVGTGGGGVAELTVDGGDLSTDNLWLGWSGFGLTDGVLNMKDGYVSVWSLLNLGEIGGGDGTINQTGGTINVRSETGGIIHLGYYDGVGRYNLNDGVLITNAIWVDETDGSGIDIELGEIHHYGDVVAGFEAFRDAGVLTAYDGAGTLHFDYDLAGDYTRIWAEAPAAPALVGHWELDGDVADSVGSGNGTVWGSGGVDPATASFTAGWVNQALELTGSGQYVDVPRVVADDFTIALWVKTSNLGFMPEKTAWDWGKGLIGGKVVGGSNDFGLSVLNSRFCFGVGDTSISSTSGIANGSWNHLAATRDKNTGLIRIFVNGVQENSATGITASLTDPGSLAIGNVIAGWPGYTYHWASYDGLIDDVRMYNYVLSDTDLQALASGSTPIPSEPACSIQPVGDLNKDCVIGIDDFALMAWHWLDNNWVVPNSQWTVQEAWDWYDQLDPIAGCNYIPRNAINPTEMWQGKTFDPVTISEELGWAQSAGINSARVFIPYVVYEEDAEGLIDRMEQFLTIADNNNISVTFVLLDASGGSEPFTGIQPDPVPGVHNSGWTQSPGQSRQQQYWSDLQRYVVEIIKHFANDQRVLMWDLCNEWSDRVILEKAFIWARSANPSQPLTSTDWPSNPGDFWDVATYHDYGDPTGAGLGDGRPVVYTETHGRVASYLPAIASNKVGFYIKGLVKGKTQTIWPIGSNPGDPEPSIWLGNLLHPDGSAYDQAEIELILDFPNMFNSEN